MRLKRDEKGRPIYKPEKGKPSRFPPGVSGNLKGRKKGSVNPFSISTMAKAIKSVEYDKKVQFLIAWIDASWENPSAMSEIMNYMMPKLKSIESLNASVDVSMSDEEAHIIREKLKERFASHNK